MEEKIMLKKLIRFTTVFAIGLMLLFALSLVAFAAPPAAFISATYDASTGAFVITGTNMVSVPGSNNDIQLSKVIITDSVNHSYTLKSKGEITNSTTATIVLSSAERAALNAFLDKSGTESMSGGKYQINVLAGWNGTSSSTDFSEHPLTVSNVAGLTSATYDMSTGKLVITGSYIASVSGSKNDVLPKYITLSDGNSHAYTLTTGGVDVDSSTKATITLNSADQIALQYWINKNGTKSVEENEYQFTAAYGWNGQQLAQMGFYPITVSNYANPEVSINNCSITLGAAITTASTGLTVSKPGYVYIVPADTDFEEATKEDLDALVAGGTALKGAAMTPSKISIATTGKTVAFRMTEAYAEFKAVAIDLAGAMSEPSANTLIINNVPAPALTATAAPGSVTDSTKVTATAASGNTLAYKLSSAPITAPKTFEIVESIIAYTSGTNITGASPTNKYLGVYELDGDGKVIRYKLITLAASNIKLPSFKSASALDTSLVLETDTLVTSSVPSIKAFTVKINGTAVAVTKVEIAGDGKSVTLTLARAVSGGDTVTVAYTKPTANYLVNAAGNAVANLAAGALSVSTPTLPPSISGASIADKSGEGFDGMGVITLPEAAEGNAYAYRIVSGSYTLPYLGEDVSSWTDVEDGDTLVFGANASEANGKVLLVAEINGETHAVVKASAIIVSGIADYVPATSGSLRGTVDFSNDEYVADAIDNTERTFTITVDGSETPIEITISSEIATLSDLITSIQTQLTAAESTATVASVQILGETYLVITSGTTGSASSIAVGGTDAALFFGDTPVVNNGSDAMN